MTFLALLAAESHYLHWKCLWSEVPISKWKINQDIVLILCLNSGRKTLCSFSLNNKNYVFKSSLPTPTILNRNSLNFLFYLGWFLLETRSSIVVAELSFWCWWKAPEMLWLLPDSLCHLTAWLFAWIAAFPEVTMMFLFAQESLAFIRSLPGCSWYAVGTEGWKKSTSFPSKASR